MNDISPQQLLSQIRTMNRSLQLPDAPSMDRPAGPVRSEFGGLLKNTIDSVNSIQKASSSAKMDLQMEKPGVELHEVMIASAKADVAFRAATEVRNKLVTAYQDIMNMPV
ncbi:MAG: flagellar hook-basal body complex protein FliE [Pseudomonadota bacterium]